VGQKWFPMTGVVKLTAFQEVRPDRSHNKLSKGANVFLYPDSARSLVHRLFYSHTNIAAFFYSNVYHNTRIITGLGTLGAGGLESP